MATLYGILVFWLVVVSGSAVDRALDVVAIQNALTSPLALLHVAATSTTTLRELAAARGLEIGAATEALPLVREPEFARMMANQFTLLSTENRLKFNIIHPEKERYDFTQGDVIVRFAEANGMKVRGHCLIWHEHFPKWLEKADLSTADAETVVRDHIRTVMQHYAGRIAYWDVVNEAISWT